ncbi:unnamed protein product [Rotaria sp. Silwood1]|nr:unnamed protein product [Rotaria sp. Silwood1]CAF1624547.1 unnamed protein product [Rotaria sp. Silwood1]CAF3797977.1 unnamed protein product [Rotaria sp. Silwood1]CAF3908400.1 unnamed protein product [Rotaria sp. Silwood1]CAF5011184.1 unnamed protein product [Rotaria sp. Silwood1]
MTTPAEIVKEKLKEVVLLWNSKRGKEVVIKFYAPDACVSEGGVSYNGHDEMLNVYEKFQDVKVEMTPVDVSSPSDDCVVQKCACEWNGQDRTCTLTWKKIDGDWKVIREEWL